MSQKAEKSVSKELKIVTRPVVTIDAAMRDGRKMGVMAVISSLNEISERGLVNCLYILKTEKGRDLGYQFQVVGRAVNSRELLEDVRILLYLGLLEVTGSRKLRLTSLGKEVLEKLGPEWRERLEELSKAVEEVKQRVLSEESLLSMVSSAERRRRRR